MHRDLGMARLVGAAELKGRGELQREEIYAHLRHPRYAGSSLAILGACLLTGMRAVWAAAGVWLAFMLLAIAFEERGLRARFGSAYWEYCRRVPRFIPLRWN